MFNLSCVFVFFVFDSYSSYYKVIVMKDNIQLYLHSISSDSEQFPCRFSKKMLEAYWKHSRSGYLNRSLMQDKTEDNESLSVAADSFHSDQYTKLDKKAQDIIDSIRKRTE